MEKKKVKTPREKKEKPPAQIKETRPPAEEQDFCCAEAPNGFLPKQERD